MSGAHCRVFCDGDHERRGQGRLQRYAGQRDFRRRRLPGRLYGNCAAAKKIDFSLLSPALFDKVAGGGVFRKGMSPGARATRWEAYPEVARKEDAASDHAAWADMDL